MASKALIDRVPQRMLCKHALSSATSGTFIEKVNTGYTSQDRVLFKVTKDTVWSASFSTLVTAAQISIVSNASTALANTPDQPTVQTVFGRTGRSWGTPANVTIDSQTIVNEKVDVNHPIYLLPFAIYSRLDMTLVSSYSGNIYHEIWYTIEEVDAETFSEFIQSAYPLS